MQANLVARSLAARFHNLHDSARFHGIGPSLRALYFSSKSRIKNETRSLLLEPKTGPIFGTKNGTIFWDRVSVPPQNLLVAPALGTNFGDQKTDPVFGTAFLQFSVSGAVPKVCGAQMVDARFSRWSM